ncbi:NAD-dependent epimerase/dehydratase family protein [Pigmentibacter sp. JX0631]|uniref:NAD-dependent epimerase/dehydratase family protein n=1 Tax=Pigmentibacter sp. JX0631 TaxID=2976982 RepID=UPI002468E479|nr:NAD-dependent epimerase/dehydratase family protein [Pigmentibacter sp. JX0631]WGL60610.1 NAD-dependent epimerase/dehydratase family protein [Pigmentibacter sp. JX0631]
MKKILVTGGNGHLGYNLVKQLSENGFQVKTTVRNINDDEKIKHLKKLSNIEIVEAELLNKESLRYAMKDIDAVIHSASPVLLWSSNVKKEIEDPIILGTQNVLESACENNIKKIVFTSSCSACGMSSSLNNPLTENNWNQSSDFPLLKAKIDAEKWAFWYCNKNNIKLISILPPTIIGPNFSKVTPSLSLYYKIFQKQFFTIPNGGCHIVDVRDVAKAHVNALLFDQAEGRYLVAGEYFDFKELLKRIKKIQVDAKIPNYLPPLWTFYLLNSVDWLSHKVMKKERNLSRKIISNFFGKYQYVSVNKAKQDLKWNPIPADKTIFDTLNWFHKLI